MEKNYVVMHAKLQCDQGCMENYLNVGTDHGVYKIAEDGTPYPVMCASDMIVGVNISYFGKCSSKGKSSDYKSLPWNKKLMGGLKKLITGDGACDCEPSILTPWYDVNESNVLEQNGVLTESSKLVCEKGGVISVVFEKGEGE